MDRNDFTQRCAEYVNDFLDLQGHARARKGRLGSVSMEDQASIGRARLNLGGAITKVMEEGRASGLPEKEMVAVLRDLGIRR